MRIIRNGKRGRPRVVYTKQEQKFYKDNKRRIITGLDQYVAKNKIKQTFFANVQEEKDVNSLSNKQAMNKVLRSRMFTSEEENFLAYKKEAVQKAVRGHTKNIKNYLGMKRNEKLELDKWINTYEGWTYNYNGKTVLLQRNQDTKTEGYNIIYA